MKKYALVMIIFVTVFLVSSCNGFFRNLFNVTGPVEGMELSVTADLGSRAATRGSTYITPQNVKIAFSKIWFPTPATFETLKDANPDHDGGEIYLTETTAAELAALEFYKPLDYSVDTPYEFDSSAGTVFEPTDLPGYDAEFHGILMEMVWFQMDMADYSLRWYFKDSGDYRAQDVLVSTDGGATWKFAFLQRTVEYNFYYDIFLEGGPGNPVDNNDNSDVGDPVITDRALITRDTREVSGQYYENSHAADRDPLGNYFWQFLQVNGFDDYYEQLAVDEGYDTTTVLDNETIVQYFPVTRNVPNDDNGFVEGENWDDIGQKIWEGYWRETGLMGTCPILLSGYSDDSYDNPSVISTQTEEENDARIYMIEIRFYMSPEAGYSGLGIDLLDGASFTADATWEQMQNSFSTQDDMALSFSPIVGGTEVLFGWEDFNGDGQGAFSEDAMAE